MSLGFNH